METKFCKYCQKDIDITDDSHWYKHTDKSMKAGYSLRCKVRIGARGSEYHMDNKDKIAKYKKEYNKKWYSENTERISEWGKEYYEKNREEKKYKSKLYRENNPDKRKKFAKLYYERNKDKRLEQVKTYVKKNRDKVNEYRRGYQKKKMKSDVNYQLIRLLRCRLNHAIKGHFKSGSAVEDLGCSIDFLKQYLESKFLPGMTWDNRGAYSKDKKTWMIDHILPLASFDLTNREELLKACHYTNLQPLWAEDNLKKGAKIK